MKIEKYLPSASKEELREINIQGGVKSINHPEKRPRGGQGLPRGIQDGHNGAAEAVATTSIPGSATSWQSLENGLRFVSTFTYAFDALLHFCRESYKTLTFFNDGKKFVGIKLTIK